MWRFFPVVRPDYVVVLNRHADLFDTDVPVREYKNWSLPIRGRVAAQVMDPARAPTGALAERAP